MCTLIVKMPTICKMVDSLTALEVCIWQVVDRTVVDTTFDQFIEFNGTNSSYGYRAESSTPRVPIELPFSFRFSFNDLQIWSKLFFRMGVRPGMLNLLFD